MKKLALLALSVAGLALAGGKSYSFTLYQTALLGSTQLAPGDYQVSVVDQKAVVRNGKIHDECAVKVESGTNKYSSTTVQFDNGDGKMHLREIHIGGSTTKLVFTE